MGRFKILLFVGVLVCLPAVAFASTEWSNMTGGGSRDVLDTKHVTQLPDTSDYLYVSLILHDDWRSRPDEVKLVAWWQTDQSLQPYRAKARFNLYTPSDPWYRKALASVVPSVPTILVQEPNGVVLYPKRGDVLPTGAEEFGRLFPRLWQRRHPDQPLPPSICPHRQPPEEKPVPEPETQLPDVNVQPTEPPAEPEFPWAVTILGLVLTGVVVGTLVMVAEWKKRTKR